MMLHISVVKLNFKQFLFSTLFSRRPSSWIPSFHVPFTSWTLKSEGTRNGGSPQDGLLEKSVENKSLFKLNFK